VSETHSHFSPDDLTIVYPFPYISSRRVEVLKAANSLLLHGRSSLAVRIPKFSIQYREADPSREGEAPQWQLQL